MSLEKLNKLTLISGLGEPRRRQTHVKRGESQGHHGPASLCEGTVSTKSNGFAEERSVIYLLLLGQVCLPVKIVAQLSRKPMFVYSLQTKWINPGSARTAKTSSEKRAESVQNGTEPTVARRQSISRIDEAFPAVV